jgi:hypothetical protein
MFESSEVLKLTFYGIFFVPGMFHNKLEKNWNGTSVVIKMLKYVKLQNRQQKIKCLLQLQMS